MLEISIPNETPQSESPFEAALKAALAQCEVTGQYGRKDKALILELTARLPSERQGPYLARMAALKPENRNPGGDVYQKVIHLIDHHRQPEWKNSEIQKKLEESGTETDAKQVGNFTSYLAKCGRFERLARGHYRDRFGNVIVTAEDLPVWNGPEPSDE